MMAKNLSILLISVVLWCIGCASHPTVIPKEPRKGVTNMGFTLSAENLFPAIWMRRGLNRYTDVGFRLGIPPWYGTGVDINRTLFRKGRKWDTLNLAYNFSPNSSYDFTYYKFKRARKAKKGKSPGVNWVGARSMVIPKGMLGGQSLRFGMLYGRKVGEKMGVEFGYFHNLSSTTSDDEESESYPSDFVKNISEHSARVGYSFQVFYDLGQTKKQKK